MLRGIETMPSITPKVRLSDQIVGVQVVLSVPSCKIQLPDLGSTEARKPKGQFVVLRKIEIEIEPGIVALKREPL
jgi:hypothetical protein